MSWNEKFHNYLKNDLYRNVLILFSGSSIAQAIPLIATIVLTRIFNKDQFGVFFIYSSLCMVLSMIVSLKLELAIILPSKKEDGRILFFASLITSLILSFILFLAVFFLYKPITSVLGEKNIGKLLYLLPISLFLLGIVQSGTYWLNRMDNFKGISFIKIIKSTTSSVLQITFGFLAFLKWGLVVGLIGGQITSALYSLIISFKEKVNISKENIYNRVISLITKYKNIPIFNTSIAISNTLSNHLPIFLLTGFYSLEMTAFYGLAHRIITTPMGLISQSVGQVLYREATKRYNSGENLRKTILATYKKLAKLAIIPFILLFIFAPYIFTVLFGHDWEMAGTFIRFLIPWLFLMFLNSPMTYIITILNKQKQLLVYDVLLLTFRFLALFTGYYFFNNVLYSILLFGIVGAIFNLFLLFYIIKISNTKLQIEIT